MLMWDDEPGDVDEIDPRSNEKDPRALGLLFGPGGPFGPPAPAEGGGGAGEDDTDDEASGKMGQHIFMVQ